MKDERYASEGRPSVALESVGEPIADPITDQIAKLRREIELRDEFIAAAAHELRNPLSPVYMQVEHLREMVSSASAEVSGAWLLGQLDALLGRFDHFLDALNRLLDASRISEGKIQLQPAPCDLVDAVRTVLASGQRELAAARSAVQLDTPPALVGTWDRLRLEQIIWNLLSNAIRYGAGRPITIAVRGDPQVAQLVVHDRGVGISSIDQARIFRRFERARDAGRSSGFGVGLWVVSELCRAMNGTVEVVSELGRGATFTVTLPRAR